jgi:hypothetical protein
MISRDTFSIIRAWQDANFTDETYSSVYTFANTAAIINGVNVNLVATSVLNIKIDSFSAATNNTVYLLGNKSDVYFGSPNLGSISL